MNAPATISPFAHLPEALRLAAEAGGIEAAVGLARALGGKTVHIPLRAGAAHPLVVAGGRKAADAIMRQFGGEKMQFPKGGNLVRHALAAEVLSSEDGSLNKAVEVSGLHVRTVMRLKLQLKNGAAIMPAGKPRAARAADPRQMDIEDMLRTSATAAPGPDTCP